MGLPTEHQRNINMARRVGYLTGLLEWMFEAADDLAGENDAARIIAAVQVAKVKALYADEYQKLEKDFSL